MVLPGFYMKTAIKKIDILFWIAALTLVGTQSLGLGFGLPGQYHPDEYFVNISTFQLFHDLKTLTFPSTYYVLGIRWLYFAEFVIAYLAGSCFGIFHSFREFYALYFAYGNPYVDAASPLFYLLPRAASFVLSCGSILFVYAIVKKITNDTFTAKLAAITTLLLPAGYLYSHYGSRESAICFCTLMLFCHACFVFNPAKLKSIIVAGILLGISIAVKENAMIFIVLYAYYLFTSCKLKHISLQKAFLYFAIICIVATFLFFLLNPQRLFINNASETTRQYMALSSTNLRSSISSHLIYPLVFIREFSVPGLLLLFVGAIVSWLKLPVLRPILCIIICSYIALDFVNANGLNKADRFIMNIFLPFFIIGITGITCTLKNPHMKKMIVMLPIIIGLCNSHELISIFRSFNGHDTRDDARAWIQKNIPAHSKIARELIYTPSIDISKYTVVKSEWALGRYSFDSLQKAGADYVIISDRFVSGWILGDSVSNNYKSFFPHVIKTFQTPWQPHMNDFHSPKIYFCDCKRHAL